MKKILSLSILAFCLVVVLVSCKKDEAFIPNNNAPYYDGIPTVKVENYVNRLFIDLIGREPLDTEMVAEVAKLRAASLDSASRIDLITRLQTDTAFVAGDSSYFIAYHQRLYELFKFRMIEGASIDIINQYIGIAQGDAAVDSLNGDSLNFQLNKQRVIRLQKLITIPFEYRAGLIDINEVYARLLYNDVYDEINMNSFNFVRASFNDLFSRFPTQAEFNAAYAMVESNTATTVMGQPGQNKANLVQILTHSNEFDEGLIRWAYRTYLARLASTPEVYNLLLDFNTTHNFEKVQLEIMKTDEYANF